MDRPTGIEVERIRLGLSTSALWIRYVGLGGDLSLGALRAALLDEALLHRDDRAVVEQALTEAAMDLDA